MTTGYILVDTPNPYQSQGGYPRRGGYRPSGTAIVHTSEGVWTSGVGGLTNLVRTRSDWGCYHRACDWQDIALYYPWEWETWQDTETNNWAVGIAAACKTTDWGNMPADVEEGYYRNMARMAADFVQYMRETYGVEVPRRRISGAEARARVPGFAAHGDSGVSRSDPGVNFDWDRFFRYTNQVLDNTEQDDIVTPEQIEKLDQLNKAHHEATRNHINGKLAEVVDQVATAVWSKALGYADPKTAEVTGTTSPGTAITFRDFQDEATRRTVVETGAAILSAVQAVQLAAGPDAAAVAAEALEEFKSKVDGLRVELNVTDGAE